MNERTSPPRLDDSLDEWRAALETGHRRTLSTLLSFAESSREDQRTLVSRLLEQTSARRSVRVGLTGVPGAGKSCLIEALGGLLLERGKRVAALMIDPSSQITGGSILGDKLRMPRLSNDPRAYIRGVPSGGAHGGLGPGTGQAVRLLESAGFDVVFVETVGTGQSEVDAAYLVDCLILALSPSDGDDIQGMKRGITEHADLVVVNKADVDPNLSNRTAGHYENAIKLMRGGRGAAFAVSARTGEGMASLWSSVEKECQGKSASKDQRTDPSRRTRSVLADLVASRVREEAIKELERPGGEGVRLTREVDRGEILPAEAAQRVLHLIRSSFELR